MLWAAAPGRRCAELSGNTASKASAENAIKISRALMAWLYSHWRRSSSQSEGMTVQFCVSWFAGKEPAKKIARTDVPRRKAKKVRAKCRSTERRVGKEDVSTVTQR